MLTNKTKKQTIAKVKSLLPAVVSYQELKGYSSFDYGYLYGEGVWECSFFDEKDNVVEYFTGKTSVEIYEQLS